MQISASAAEDGEGMVVAGVGGERARRAGSVARRAGGKTSLVLTRVVGGVVGTVDGRNVP